MASPNIKAVFELLKPITWFPPMWAFTCGVIAADVPLRGRPFGIVLGLLLSGPLVCATSQAVNDWFDREVDAINEPGRPIPSGRLPGRWGLAVAIVWTALSLCVGLALGPWGLAASGAGLAMAWAYSAPPFRLKRNGWFGNAACAVCYEGLAWATGSAVMAGGLRPGTRSLSLAALFSVGAHGIMTLNDFKSVRGDRQMGIGSLPVRLGVEAASRAACLIMALPQVGVILLLAVWHRPLHALTITGLLLLQLLLMDHFLQYPSERAIWYSGFGVPVFVAGMMVSAFGVRGLPGG